MNSSGSRRVSAASGRAAATAVMNRRITSITYSTPSPSACRSAARKVRSVDSAITRASSSSRLPTHR
jgi:hypothetical protein